MTRIRKPLHVVVSHCERGLGTMLTVWRSRGKDVPANAEVRHVDSFPFHIALLFNRHIPYTNFLPWRPLGFLRVKGALSSWGTFGIASAIP